MKFLLKSATFIAFSAIFFIVVVPLGACIRLVFDPLRLRRHNRTDSYFHMRTTGVHGGAQPVRNSVEQFTTRNL